MTKPMYCPKCSRMHDILLAECPPAKVGDVQEIPGPLKLYGPGALHATDTPTLWNGDRWWLVALHAPVVKEGDKYGSLKREILEDLGPCPYSGRG